MISCEDSVRKVTGGATLFAFVLALPAWGSQTQTAPAPVPTSLQIEHDPLACVTTETAPLIGARIEPGREVSTSRVYWRALGAPVYFYYSAMSGEVSDFRATLPRPLAETARIEYYLEATDRSSRSRVTPEYVVPVVPKSVCGNKGLGVTRAGAGLTIGLTNARQRAVPAGFNQDDIAQVILVSGTVVTVAKAMQLLGGPAPGGTEAATPRARAGAAPSGGISAGLLVAGGAGVVAAGAAVAAGGGRGGNKASSTPLPNPTPTPTATPAVSRFISAEASWSGPGEVDVELRNPSDQPVGDKRPAGCETTANRTARVVLQGTSFPPGTYRVILTGKPCGTETPASLSAVVSVQSDAGQKCAASLVIVPVGVTVTGCTFNVP